MAKAIGGVALKRKSGLACPLREEVAGRGVLQGAAGRRARRKSFLLAHSGRRQCSQRQQQFRCGLALLDAQRLILEIHRANFECDDLRRSQTVMGHKVQDRVVAPARLACSVDRAQQSLDQRPRHRPGRLLAAVGARRVYTVKTFANQAAFEDIPSGTRADAPPCAAGSGE